MELACKILASVSRTILGFGLSLATVLTLSASASAQQDPAPAEPSEEAGEAAAPLDPVAKQREADAKTAYTQAAKAAGEGHLEAALTLYRKADELVPAPAPKFKIALTLDKLGRLAEAVDAYEAFLDVKPDPDKFFSKIDSARERIHALHAIPGKIKVTTKPAAPPNLVLAVDRVPQTESEIVVMPGSHSITAVADGWTGSQTITVGPAETKDVVIEMVADRPAPKLTVTPPPPQPAQPIIVAAPAPAPAPSSHQARTAAYVMFGAASIQAIVGTVFAVQAVHSKSVYQASPTRDNLEAFDRQTVFADAFYATGLVSVVTGVVMLLLDDSPSAKRSSDRP